MIVFDLHCRQGHTFEGWFASSDEFARQRERKLVRCPLCDDAEVEKRPSARVSVPKSTPAPTAPAPTQQAVTGLPPHLLAQLREIVRNTENVGAQFPEEARKIHYEEAPPRAIRGQATREEAQALQEEGIEFTSLPPLLSADRH
jgi:hypothetical protein